ncbi:MAG: hydroxymethylglutaryl-CoA lyase, partial [Cyclobacteriaceae bacterium]|nr:hydroxymethylglutaryl-CoA lyase [Cyclobacteriaceae bacterium]
MKIIECPRDAMQGLSVFIPTDKKVAYLSQLLKVGFDTIDFGSFVSPKAIPQLRDTAEVLSKLDLTNVKSKLLAIVANTRGAMEAAEYQSITYLGFPFSISETFQQRNTNKSIEDALLSIKEIQEICLRKNKVLVIYISMGFGNPYGDPYDADIVEQFTELLSAMNVRIISLADTIGVSNPDQIQKMFGSLTKKYSAIEFGVHLHSSPVTAVEKIAAAYASGCQRFDGAIKG